MTVDKKMMTCLQERAEKIWVKNVLDILERGTETQAKLARQLGKPAVSSPTLPVWAAASDR